MLIKNEEVETEMSKESLQESLQQSFFSEDQTGQKHKFQEEEKQKQLDEGLLGKCILTLLAQQTKQNFLLKDEAQKSSKEQKIDVKPENPKTSRKEQNTGKSPSSRDHQLKPNSSLINQVQEEEKVQSPDRCGLKHRFQQEKDENKGEEEYFSSD